LTGDAGEATERTPEDPRRDRTDAVPTTDAEARLRAVWGATSDALALSDPDGVVLAANPAYLELYGFAAAEVVGRPFSVIFPEGQRAWADARYRAVFADPAPPRGYETRVRRKDGTERDVEARAGFVVEGGRRVGLVSAVRDVTERVVAEAALRASEERFRAALGIETVGAIFFDAEGRITDANDAFLRMGGYAREDLAGGRLSWRALTPPEWMEPSERAFAELRATGRTAPYEKEYLRKDGSRRWGLFAATRLPGGDGFEFVVDVTGRRRVEDALGASEARFRTLVQRSADAIQLVAPDGTILYSSDSVEAVLGYRPEEVLGRSIAPYLHPDDRPGVAAWLAGVAAAPGAVATKRYRARHKDGSWAWLEATIANHLGTPAVNAVVGNVRNVTERVRAEAEREAFVDAAAHDLKTPLTSIRGQAQLLRRRLRRGQGVEPAELEPRLAAIEAAADRMAALVDEMMDAAHLAAGRALELRPAATDLVALAAAAAEEARRGGSGHAVRVAAEAPALVGAWDAARLERVLANLLSNAVKYGPAGSEVVVRVGRDEDAAGAWAVVAVRDEGVGIPAADLPRLFDRFHRAANVAGRTAGAGIGLAGARRIVEQHGGAIAVESVEGRGSTFTVRLPLAVAPGGG
jgi:PAS domain S-box-containing protein